MTKPSTPQKFINAYKDFAFDVERETGIPAIAILAQAALESGWGKKSIGNNIFGVKYKSGDWGYQEVLTTEHSKSPNDFKGKKIKSVTYDSIKKIYVYKIWDYFADYPTVKDAFLGHARLLLSKRYKPALRWKHSPKRFLIALWRCGYATDTDYGRKMCKMVDSVTKRL